MAVCVHKYMVVERFKPGCWDAAYERFLTEGRLLPDGLHYLNSWSNQELSVCYQLMETDDENLFTEWFSSWNDLVDFELVKVD